MNIKRFSKKTHLLGFVFVMLANLCLTIFLIQNILAQTSDDKFKDQPPIIAKVLKQNESPLFITLIDVDNSNPNYQSVNYTVQNITNKPIRAFTLTGISKSTGKIITRYLTVKLFQPTELDNGEIIVERENIKLNEVLALSIDYVEFEDGSSWGKDYYQQSEKIVGERAGRKEVIRKLKDLVTSNDLAALSAFLDQDLSNIIVPETNSNQTDIWQKGFQFGYKSTIFSLQRIEKQNIKELSSKLNEMEKFVK